ncbi:MULTISPECIES: hypothetical protein [Citrobacter freundii complex]|uniref:hypothetical protein n=1 Tax=Citrobacter freundii complex TaxID=1344959 RepID=UPI001F29F91D|nr:MULTISPECIES: hypothetical protein [Citrobacter freundii complex]WFV17782.1 hypothetical protein NFJ22_22730 [Citrobacter braakii]
MFTRQQSGLSPCKTSPAAVPYLMMTSAPGAGTFATGLVNSACAGCLWLTASGPHSAMLMAMHNPAHSYT